jgi:2-amino-4-hydroxy-6-hydroxymethyldihydropteridine diphosphokinase
MSILYKNPPTFAAIALGSNIGNAEEFFHRACKLLTDNGFVLEAMGPVITTSPVDCPPGTADFSNSALTGYFDRAPEDLLAITQRIEVELGRPADHGFHDSRTIDLDIVIFGNTVMRTPRLTLPHPRAQERRFVLEPLAEIAPELIFPDTMQSVRAALDMLEK